MQKEWEGERDEKSVREEVGKEIQFYHRETETTYTVDDITYTVDNITYTVDDITYTTDILDTL